MRATISFDVDLSRVSQTMLTLVTEESKVVNRALEVIANAKSQTLVGDLDHALEELAAATNQLQQYRQMLLTFDRARLETMLPQPASSSPLPLAAEGAPPDVSNFSQLQEALQNIQGFDSFLSNIPKDEEAEVEIDDEPEEG